MEPEQMEIQISRGGCHVPFVVLIAVFTLLCYLVFSAW